MELKKQILWFPHLEDNAQEQQSTVRAHHAHLSVKGLLSLFFLLVCFFRLFKGFSEL